ncbi:hypothetical protein DPSP01_012829 [Paraphaeosphaeria sporulosa]
MRFTLLVFASAVAASPFPWAKVEAVTSATSSVLAAPTGNATKTRHHNHHKEPTPTLQLPCSCQQAIIPAGQMNAKELCEYKYFLNLACFHQTQGGCASPTLATAQASPAVDLSYPSYQDSKD